MVCVCAHSFSFSFLCAVRVCVCVRYLLVFDVFIRFFRSLCARCLYIICACAHCTFFCSGQLDKRSNSLRHYRKIIREGCAYAWGLYQCRAIIIIMIIRACNDDKASIDENKINKCLSQYHGLCMRYLLVAVVFIRSFLFRSLCVCSLSLRCLHIFCFVSTYL